MNYPQFHDSTHVFGLLTKGDVVEKKRPGERYQRSTGPDQQPLVRSDLWL